MAATALQNDLTPLTPSPEPDFTTRVEGTNLWFVQFKSAPSVKGTSSSKLNAEKQAFRQAAADAGNTTTRNDMPSEKSLETAFQLKLIRPDSRRSAGFQARRQVNEVGVIEVPKEAGISHQIYRRSLR